MELGADAMPDPAHGLVEIELAEAGSITVDGSPMGRFAKRRLILTPGPHRIEVESEHGKSALDLDVPRGLALRVVSGNAPSPKASAAPSPE
jgi:hypothetical protein